MHFKVLKGTTLFDELQSVRTEINRVNNEARTLAKSLGFEELFMRSGVLGGGITGLVPVNGETKPEGWRWAFKDRTSNAIIPNTKNIKSRELTARIKALPVVHYSALNNVLKYDDEISKRPNDRGNGTRFNLCPMVYWGDKVHIIEVPVYSGKYQPVDGMIEILASEYSAILDAWGIANGTD